LFIAVLFVVLGVFFFFFLNVGEKGDRKGFKVGGGGGGGGVIMGKS
jgi:hypothetical protein